MLRSFKRFFDDMLASPSAQESAAQHEHRLRLATAALMMEMVRADFETHVHEREHVLALLKTEFELTQAEAGQLAELGAEASQQAVSLYEFTEALDKALDVEDKIRVLEMLWHVAYSDGALDKYEEYLMRKLADLLHISHRQMLQAKHRVLEAKGLG